MYFDLIIIGSGPGGYVAAIRAAQLGLKTAIVEKENLGGVCLNWGCIPTKSLLKSATIFNSLKKASKYGMITNNLKLDFKKIILRSRYISDSMNKGVLFLMKKNNIKILYGEAKICKNKIVYVIDKYGNKKKYNALNIIIATGAKYKIFNTVKKNKLSTIIGYREAIILKYSIIQSIEYLYYIKCTKVIIKNNKNINKILYVDIIISAIGICPNTENLGLEEIGITLNSTKHICVDKYYSTNVKGYYAIGDVIP